eukprot:8089763-Pyramimonas_sp.AAC.1
MLKSEFGQNVFGYVERLHKNLGHPSTEVFVRMLTAASAREEVIACAKHYKCASCAERNRASQPPKSAPTSWT